MSPEKTEEMVLPQSADPTVFGPALHWWRETYRTKGRIPSRADLSPHHITPAALPYVMLIDIADGGDMLRWRLAGTAHVDRNKRDLKGVNFEDVYRPGSRILSYVKQLYKDLVLHRRPIWVVNEIVHRQSRIEAGFPLAIRRLMLPLTNIGDEIDLCLTILLTDYNQDVGVSCGEQWRRSDEVGEIERLLLSAG